MLDPKDQDRLKSFTRRPGFSRTGERDAADQARRTLGGLRHEVVGHCGQDERRSDRSAAAARPRRRRRSTDRDDPNAPPLFPTIVATLQKYLALKPHEYVALACWILHAHVFENFTHSPKLALLSPVRGCGKTTVLKIIRELTPRAYLTASVSAAAIYESIETERPTVLIDEGDNLEFATAATLKAVLNATHERGHTVRRFGSVYHTFAPVAIAAIGVLPMALMHRCIVLDMQRARPGANLKRFNPEEARDVQALALRIRIWAKTVPAVLDVNPDLPKSLRNRAADNWRPLIAVAETLDARQEACRAATNLTGRQTEEDPGVLLLKDILRAMDNPPEGEDRDVMRIPTAKLLERLNSYDESPWGAWRGLKGDQQPRPLTAHNLAALLWPFKIRPKTIWTGKPRVAHKGYQRQQFEAAWARYCQPDTPSHYKDFKGLMAS